MNEQRNEMPNYVCVIIGIVIGFFFFFLFTRIGSYIGFQFGGPAREVAVLDYRRDQLDRNYAEGQRTLEEQQRVLGESVEGIKTIVRYGVDECLGYVETAREINNRTGESTSRAIGNLQEAVALIKQGIEERKNLEMEFDRLRTSLLGLRRMVGVHDSTEVKE